MEVRRFELLTLGLQSRCSTAELYPRLPVSDLSGTVWLATKLAGLRGLEPLTSRLSGVCSNHLSYKPDRVALGAKG